MNLEKLVKIRKEAGYTQQMLASHFGFTRQNWSAKERGLHHFRLSEIKKEVAKCCECGASIYNTEDYYLVGDEYICESCRDIFMDNHIVFAEE